LIIIGAHYDSRRLADNDPIPELADKPVPGANDGASGVAVLLELARVLPNDLNHEIRLVFFDAEDQGNLNNWEWIVGSTAYAASLDTKPEAVIIIDMIGDKDLKVVKERYSTPELVDSIWLTAKQLGYGDIFVDSGSLQIMDDHLPFLNAGYAAVDIIDFTYPAWHTSQDTPNQVSASSLEIIGNVLYAWLCSR
jgi:Zn-dependent M28 family amino/carboxypeptidase